MSCAFYTVNSRTSIEARSMLWTVIQRTCGLILFNSSSHFHLITSKAKSIVYVMSGKVLIFIHELWTMIYRKRQVKLLHRYSCWPKIYLLISSSVNTIWYWFQYTELDLRFNNDHGQIDRKHRIRGWHILLLIIFKVWLILNGLKWTIFMYHE